MKKFLTVIALSFCFSGLAQAQNTFWFTLGGPNWSISANNYLYQPYGYYYPQQIIVPQTYYYRQQVQVPVTVCQDIYTRDQFGNGLIYKNCWTELRWVWQ